MKDLQNERDFRNLPVDRVGVRGVRYPITVLDKEHKEQPTIALVNMYVELPKEFRGTHMSRFIEILNHYRWRIHTMKVIEILKRMMEALPSHSAHVELSFPFFREKKAPVSGVKSLMSYDVEVSASLYEDMKHDIVLKVMVPVMTLCPCSKEISRAGAHNQRAVVAVSVKFDKMVWIEDMIEVVEKCASSELYSLLKREDEKYVTEFAYEHPVFVEDLVREIALRLKKDARIFWFRVEAESFESIHNHNAYAMIEMEV
ncbi:MAG: GTP cyclohydrolase I FolE2 [Deferribacteres bacterium]|nr:GTP cyclohydrolase I FolE2 [Deferribacteres bacterium]